ncbi:MAG: hypothetical protein IAE79_02815 [Anaerolinea sp.]|nr:hypothetical protein [Anaerolinea sp.]
MMTSAPGDGDAHIQALAAALIYTPDEADCALCLNQLDDYVAAQLHGAAYQTQFAWTAQHLDSCAACAEAYALVYEVALAEANGRLPHPAHIPAPDLAFLQSPTTDWLVALRAAFTSGPTRLALQLNEALIHLLAPAPALALTRAGTDGRYTPKLLEITPDQAQTAGLPFTLAAYADQQQPDHCLVEITVQPPGQSWPDLGGYLVTLTAGGNTVTGETDDWGTAVFPDIPLVELTSLRLDITLGNQDAKRA